MYRIWILLFLGISLTAGAATTSTPAALTAPTQGATITGSSAQFSWTAGTGVTYYKLWLGTTAGSGYVYDSGNTTATSVSVTGLPTNGVTLYARLFSYINGVWQYNSYTYTESGTPVLAALTAPTPWTTLAGNSATFTWSPGAGPTQYKLWVGTTAGTANVYDTGDTAATSATVTGLPTNGVTLCVRVFSLISAGWQYNDYIITESGTPVLAALTTPTPSSTLAGSSVTFSWSPGAGPTQWKLWLGTTPGTANLCDTGATTATTVTATGLPTSGGTLYARLFSNLSGTWQFKSYTFNAGNTGPIVYNVVLNWTPPVGSSDPVVGYELYRSPNGANQYQLLNSTVDEDVAFTDTSVVNGNAYQYIVESVDANGVTSLPTTPITVTIP